MKLEGSRILLLEDEPIIALVVEDVLLNLGARPILAESLDQAAAILAAGELDAAILDVNVHGSDSYSFARTLLERSVPFIFASGYGDSRHPGELAGVFTIAKPYTLADLEGAFARLGSADEA